MTRRHKTCLTDQNTSSMSWAQIKPWQANTSFTGRNLLIITINQKVLWKNHFMTTKGEINMPHRPERSRCHEHKSNNYKQASTSLTGQNIPKITIINQKHSERITSYAMCRCNRMKPCLSHFKRIMINKYQTEKYISLKLNNLNLF